MQVGAKHINPNANAVSRAGLSGFYNYSGLILNQDWSFTNLSRSGKPRKWKDWIFWFRDFCWRGRKFHCPLFGGPYWNLFYRARKAWPSGTESVACARVLE